MSVQKCTVTSTTFGIITDTTNKKRFKSVITRFFVLFFVCFAAFEHCLLRNIKVGLQIFTVSRIGWAAVSDRLGRWNTFQLFTIMSAPIFAVSPFLIHQCVSDPTGKTNELCDYTNEFCDLSSFLTLILALGSLFVVVPSIKKCIFKKNSEPNSPMCAQKCLSFSFCR
jgi:hypothetical protein